MIADRPVAVSLLKRTVILALLFVVTPSWATSWQELLEHAQAYRTTPALEAISKRLSELQIGLEEQFGIHSIYIGGGSARTILDHVYSGAPLDMRDLDVFAVANQKVTPRYAEKIGQNLASPTLGAYSAADLRPRVRTDPALAKNVRYQHVAGHGFFWNLAGDVLDLSIYHSPKELELNGLLNIDKIMIRLNGDTSLVNFVDRMLRIHSYPDLVRYGVIDDAARGYADWLNREAKVVNWPEFDRDPMLQAVRMARSASKLEMDSYPPDVLYYLKNIMLPGRLPRNSTSRLQLVRNLVKLLEDADAAQELKIVESIGTLSRWSKPLHTAVSAIPKAELERTFLQIGEDPIKRLNYLIEKVPETQRLPILSDIAVVYPEQAQKWATTSLLKAYSKWVGSRQVPDPSILEKSMLSKIHKVSFLTEVDRILNSESIDASERKSLLIRALLRRMPEEERKSYLTTHHSAETSDHEKWLLSANCDRVGFYTGVFNPFHLGHKSAVQSSLRNMVLDEVMVMPTVATGHNEVPIDWEDRVLLAKLGTGNFPEVVVAGPEYKSILRDSGTGPALEKYWATKPENTHWVHIMGSDSLSRFAEAGRLNAPLPNETRRMDIVAVVRQGEPMPKLPPSRDRKVYQINGSDEPASPLLRWSSSNVRQRRKTGYAIDDLVPHPVAQHIMATGLYYDPPFPRNALVDGCVGKIANLMAQGKIVQGAAQNARTILELQRRFGNQAVLRLLGKK